METVKTLDRHLYAGAEIQEVYNEITKTSTKDFLAFDKVSCFYFGRMHISAIQTISRSKLFHNSEFTRGTFKKGPIEF